MGTTVKKASIQSEIEIMLVNPPRYSENTLKALLIVLAFAAVLLRNIDIQVQRTSRLFEI